MKMTALVLFALAITAAVALPSFGQDVDKDKVIEQLQAQAAEKDKQIQELRAQAERRNKDIQELQAQVRLLQAQNELLMSKLTALEGSPSPASRPAGSREFPRTAPVATSGPASGAATRPGGKVTFLGTKTEGIRHVVFVIDTTGPMIDSYDYLKNALMDSISKLSKDQDFHIVMFSKYKTTPEMETKKLVPGTVANKVLAGKFLEALTGGGSTESVGAIRRAFEVLDKADGGKLIVFLTDVDLDDKEEAVKAFKELNADKKVAVNTYLYALTEDKAGAETMKKIATESGGTYKFFCTKDAQ